MFVDTLRGKDLKIAEQITDNYSRFRTGTLVAIDPGSWSLGYAIAHNMEFIKSGQIKVPKELGLISQRLHHLDTNLTELLTPYPEVYMLVEKVRPRTGHLYLTWAAGIAVAVGGKVMVPIEVTNSMWKKLCDEDYIKSDENDAEKILEVGLTLLREHEP